MDKEDQSVANEILNEMEESGEKEKAGNYKDATYTLSFINGSPGIVIRADHSVELDNRIGKVLPLFKRFKAAIETAPNNPRNQQPTQPDHAQQQIIQQPCNNCGGERVLNPKTGKVFCKAKCWLQNSQNQY